MIKNTPLSPTLASIYYSTAPFPIYEVSWLPAPQKLQFHERVCLFFVAKGFKAALHVVQIGAAILIGLSGTKKGE